MRGLLILAAAWCLGAGPVQFGAASHAEAQERRLDLEEAVRLGLERNQRVQAREYAVESSRSQVKSARGLFLPRLSLGYNHVWLDSIRAEGVEDVDYLDQTQDSLSLRLVQPLYAGETIVNTYRKARLQEDISVLEKESEERRLIRWIQEQFLLLLKAREDQRSLEQTVERLQVSKAAVESFAARDMVPHAEVLQARVELQDARLKLARARNQETIYKTHLDALLDFREPHDRSYVGDLSKIDLSRHFELDECLERAVKEHVDLKSVEKNIRIAAREKDIAIGRALPKVDLEVSGVDRTREYDQPGVGAFGQSIDRDQENLYWSVGLRVEWRFFSGGQQYYQRESMDFEMKRLQTLYQDTLSTIQTEVRSAYLRLEEAGQRVDATRSNVETALEGFQMEQERLKLRVGTLQSLLDAQDRLARAEADKNQALLDYQLALADLYYAMGVRNNALN